MTKKRIVIVGAGGFAREVAWLIRDLNRVEPQYEFLGYVVSDLSKLTERDSVQEVLGNEDWLETNRVRWDCLALGIGTPTVRLKVAERLNSRFRPTEWPKLIHPSAIFERESCEIGEGVIICANVVGTVNLSLGKFSLINLACTLGHEAIVGKGSVLNPTVNLSGGAEIGDGALIGTGAQVLQYVKIGARATVGAGAVVTKDVSEGTTVVGIPARPLKS